MSKAAIINNLPLGSTAWIPASATQLLYKIPPELKLGDRKLFWLPVIVKGYDSDGKTGSYSLDWERKVFIRCPSDLAVPRFNSEGQDLFKGIESCDLSKLELPNESSIGWELLLKFNSGVCSFHIGRSSTILLVNPLKSYMNRDGYTNDLNLLSSNLTANNNDYNIAVNDNLYCFLKNIKLDLKKSSQSILFKGTSGSGKTENFKKAIQYFILDSSDIPLNSFPNTRMSEYEPIGSLNNPYILPNDIECSKAIFTALKIMDYFGNAPTGSNNSSSRHLKHVKLHYSSDYKKIIGTSIEISSIDSIRICNHDFIQRPYYIFILLAASLTSQQINNDYNLNPTLIGLIIGDLYIDKSQLAEEFQLLKDDLIDLGMSNEILDEIVRCLIAFLSLFSIEIEGDDSAVLPEKSLIAIRNVEKIFNLDMKSLENYLLYRIDDKLGGGKGTLTFENRPIEAKAILNSFCSDIYQKIIKFLLDFCCEKSLDGAFIDNDDNDDIDDTIQSNKLNTIQLIDVPGYELLSLYDNNLINSFSQFTINYIDEKTSSYYINSLFNKFIKSYADDEIILQIPTSLSNINLDSMVYSDLFDRPSTGIINLLDEVCQSSRGDDRVFTDKVLTIHTRSKLVRSAGHKSITNSFIVKHSFNDSVMYDTSGFISNNKAKVNNQGQQLFAMMPFSILRTSLEGNSNMIEQIDARDSPTVIDSATSRRTGFNDTVSRRSAMSDTSNNPSLRRSSSLAYNKIRQSPYLLTRSKDILQKLLLSLDKTKNNLVLCIRPYISINTTNQSLDPEFIQPQIKSLYLSQLINLIKLGYSYRTNYIDFYDYFRLMLPYNYNLPISLDINDNTNHINLSTELFHICCNKLNIDIIAHEKNEINCVYFAKTCICIKDKLSIELINGRNQMVKKINNNIIEIQSIIRKFINYKKYKKNYKNIIIIQSLIRLYIKLNKYKKYKKSIQIIKRSYLM